MRAASEGDVYAIVAIRKTVLGVSQRVWTPNPDEDRVAMWIGAIVGLVQVDADIPIDDIQKDCAWIQSLAVHPDYQGHGIGSALAQSVVEDAKKSGVDGVACQLAQGGDRTRREKFFGNLGFNYVSPTDPPIRWVATSDAGMPSPSMPEA